MSDSWQPELENLRVAASHYDTWACERALRRLLARLDPRVVVGLAVEQATAYAPLFLSNHPDITWVGAWLEAAGKFAPMPGDLLADVEAHVRDEGTMFASAGAYAFMHANGKLVEAYTVYSFEPNEMRRHGKVVDLCTKAILSAITARVEAYCAEHYPDVWAVRLIGPPPTEESEHYTMDLFATMREAFLIYQQVTRPYHAHLWSDLADALAARLGTVTHS